MQYREGKLKQKVLELEQELEELRRQRTETERRSMESIENAIKETEAYWKTRFSDKEQEALSDKLDFERRIKELEFQLTLRPKESHYVTRSELAAVKEALERTSREKTNFELDLFEKTREVCKWEGVIYNEISEY